MYIYTQVASASLPTKMGRSAAAHGNTTSLEGLSAEELKARLAEEKAAQQLADLEARSSNGVSCQE